MVGHVILSRLLARFGAYSCVIDLLTGPLPPAQYGFLYAFPLPIRDPQLLKRQSYIFVRRPHGTDSGGGAFRNADEAPCGNLRSVDAVQGDGRKECGGSVLEARPKA